MAAAAAALLQSPFNNTQAMKLHTQAANRLYFKCLSLDFFSCLFSVGAPPTLLAAIGSELPTTVDDIMIMGVDWRSTWEQSAAETTPR